LTSEEASVPVRKGVVQGRRVTPAGTPDPGRENGAGRPRGPRTRRVGLNALRHGLTAEAVVIPGVESLKKFRAFRAGILRDLAPEGEIESALADLMVLVLWRLRRVPRHERALAVEAIERAAEPPGPEPPALMEDVSGPRPLPKARYLVPEPYALDNLMRYEAHLLRTYQKLRAELLALQANR
jgi:hypothetical protein